MAMYRFIETPSHLRNHQQRIKLKSWHVKSTAVGCVLLALTGLSVWTDGGWAWRIQNDPSPELIPPNATFKNLSPIGFKNRWTDYYSIEGGNQKVLLLGDSHAKHLRGAAQYLNKNYDLTFVFHTFTGCLPIFGTYKAYDNETSPDSETAEHKGCRLQIEEWENYLTSTRFDYVILSGRWNWYLEPREYFDTLQRRYLLIDKKEGKFLEHASRSVFVKQLDYTIKKINETGATAIVVGQVPHTGKNISGCNEMPSFWSKLIDRRCNHTPKSVVLERSQFSNQTIYRVAMENHAIPVIATDLFCGD